MGVEETLAEILNAGGSSVGELVTAEYPNGLEAVFVYARDPEGIHSANKLERTNLMKNWFTIENIDKNTHIINEYRYSCGDTGCRLCSC